MPLRQQFRILFALLCGVAHFAALPQLSMLMVAGFTPERHEMVLVPHKGHQDVLLHYDDDEAGSFAAEDATEHATQHTGHKNHHDHMLCVTQGNPVGAWSKLQLSGCVIFALPVPAAPPPLFAGWRMSESPLRARPPPVGTGVLKCLRTTVLLV